MNTDRGTGGVLGLVHFLARSLVWLGLLAGGCLAGASQLYVPKEIEAISEKWRWQNVEGLGAGSIHSFDIAEEGTVWIGMDTKVLRYDGKTFQDFGLPGGPRSGARAIKASKSGDVYALSRTELFRLSEGSWKLLGNVGANRCRRILEGDDGRLWFAADGQIHSVLGDEIQSSVQIASRLLDIELDEQGAIWALDALGGVYRCRPNGGKALVRQRWDVFESVGNGRPCRTGMIEATRDGLLWFVDVNPSRPPRSFNPKTGEWNEIDLLKSGGTHRNHSILEVEKGKLLISGNDSISVASGGGWSSISNASLNLTELTTFMRVDQDGYLWFMQSSSPHDRSRLARIDYAGERWKEFVDLNFQCDWGEGRLCFLTKSGDFVVHDTRRDLWHRYGEEDGLIDNALVAILSAEGEVWIAGSHRGVAAVNQFDGDRWRLHELPELGGTISRFSARSLSDGSLVFACGQEFEVGKGKGGIVRFRVENGSYAKERLAGAHQRIISIQEGDDGELLYSKNQIYRLDEEGAVPLELPSENPVIWIDEFHAEEDGSLWYCNWGRGVHFFDGEALRMFTVDDGLSSNYVSNLLVQENGTVYALTESGLDRYRKGKWENVAGPRVGGIREGATLRQSKDGSIWVSLASRSWYFTENSRTTQVMDFRSLRFREDEAAPDTMVFYTPESSLYSRSAYISWDGVDEWSDTPHAELQYSYQLDGGEWSLFGPETSKYFSELEAGDHTIKVRARDRDGNVDETPAALSFTIVAPFWETTWFLVAVIAIPLVVIGLVILLLAQRIRHMAELDGVRTRFLMNVSHELRSPLSLIMMPLEKFVKEQGIDENSKGLGTALRSARRLNQLVEQLLDLHKARAQKYRLNPKVGDIVRYTRLIVGDFDNLAASRDQVVRFSCAVDRYLTRFDEDLYRKLLDNLVLNAIKHSPSKAEISVSLEMGPELGEGALRLVVEDDGFGIRPTILKRIFEPFYYDSKGTSHRMRSHGIGLALVKELVDFCQATITAESPTRSAEGRQHGSRFTIEFQGMLPVDAGELEKEKALSAPAEVGSEAEGDAAADSRAKGEAKPLILLVDDHKELREYIAEELAADFAVIEAEGSREGIELALQRMPDLIISDVVMPEMDGVEFCDALKKNVATSHIPIILQTSLASRESEAAGLEAGAIDYVTKPVSIPLIKKRIASHLDARARFAKYLKSRLLEADSEEVSESVSNEAELGFVKRIREILESRWDDYSFNTDVLAKEVGMSRSSFYRKCKAVTGLPPAEAIKNYRLAKAKELLESGKWVSDVASVVGYSDPRSFTRAFQKRFDCAPSEIRRKSSV
ncbi:helix-turn-helix domain-containing protein [Pelagicoccus sp. SDUM812005]|uniref:hybrid sensor histidine kinase/response regulator transcription factor n=1 Tax=Pelagicoccus sp. SDUM812005 TaxID=3041257 RepID=UPI00280EB238|nr:helix-turn-helix domain-containing protein [Pelagicoccus sp. SDUM812005]MDQ8180284.1 helix-turn-helix domain-containing protein [Pelagicoccus sp. SDUM812005]